MRGHYESFQPYSISATVMCCRSLEVMGSILSGASKSRGGRQEGVYHAEISMMYDVQILHDTLDNIIHIYKYISLYIVFRSF